MKILLLGSSDEYLEDVIDILSSEGISVVAKVITGNTDEFCGIAEEAVLKKGYDVVIGAADNYITAGIELNKHSGIRAAAINSKRDIRLSMKSRPNVVIAVEDVSLLKDIAEAMPQEGDTRQVHMQRKTLDMFTRGQAPEQQEQRAPGRALDVITGAVQNRRAAQEAADMKKAYKARDKKARLQEKDTYAEEQQGMADGRRKRLGFMGRLKDSLGIVDEGRGD